MQEGEKIEQFPWCDSDEASAGAMNGRFGSDRNVTRVSGALIIGRHDEPQYEVEHDA